MMRDCGICSTRPVLYKKFASGKTCYSLESEPLLAHALARLIEIVGEAAGNISPEFKNAHADIPRRDIVSVRNRLIHRYFEVDHDVVLKTVTSHIPALVPLLQHILPKHAKRFRCILFILHPRVSHELNYSLRAVFYFQRPFLGGIANHGG